MPVWAVCHPVSYLLLCAMTPKRSSLELQSTVITSQTLWFWEVGVAYTWLLGGSQAAFQPL